MEWEERREGGYGLDGGGKGGGGGNQADGGRAVCACLKFFRRYQHRPLHNHPLRGGRGGIKSALTVQHCGTPGS